MTTEQLIRTAMEFRLYLGFHSYVTCDRRIEPLQELADKDYREFCAYITDDLGNTVWRNAKLTRKKKEKEFFEELLNF